MKFAHHDYIVHLRVRGAGILAHIHAYQPSSSMINSMKNFFKQQLTHLKKMEMYTNFISPKPNHSRNLTRPFLLHCELILIYNIIPSKVN